MTRITNYFQNSLIAPTIVAGEIADFNARIVPIVLTALETRKARSFWATQEDYLRGYQEITTLQRNLLMGGVDRIVQEIRALREGSGTPTEYRDPQFFSYDMPLASLATVTSNLRRGGESIADIMFDIRTLIQQGNASEEQQELALEAIQAIIVGLV